MISNVIQVANRTIIIGDVHGCVRELDLLIRELGVESCDDWLFVGDLVGKGEASLDVMDRFLELAARSTVGNHELKWLEYRCSEDFSRLKPIDREAALRFEAKHWECLEKMVPWVELPELRMIVVHGGFLPSQPWREQNLPLVATIQVVDKSGRARMRKECPDGTPWGDLWDGPEFVVYGHTPRHEACRHPHAIGLDTGCVHGGMLTALVLPEQRLVHIPARRVYQPFMF